MICIYMPAIDRSRSGCRYGGYMSFAAISFSDRFDCGIPQFGFIDNRQMSLITGDYTYE